MGQRKRTSLNAPPKKARKIFDETFFETNSHIFTDDDSWPQETTDDSIGNHDANANVCHLSAQS